MERSAARIALLFGVLLATAGIAGVSGPAAAGGPTALGDPGQTLGGPGTPEAATVPDQPPDPPGDPIGWENGYWYNESIDVSQVDGDGLSAAEQERFLARTMARVERLRGLEFTANVTLRFVSRERFRAGYPNRSLPPSVASEHLYDSFTLSEGFWEATFFYGEDESARRAIREFGAEAVLAYSAEEGFQNEVIVVTESIESPAVGANVLAHELVHALQGQHFDLEAPRYRPATHDARLAKDGLVEGAAALVDDRYSELCAAAWDCVEAPPGWSGTGDVEGVAYPFVVAQPYVDGAAYVDDIVSEGGWAAVTDRHRSLPTASEQVIHRTTEPPDRSVDAPDASTEAWRLAAREQVGEATIFLMFWRAASLHDADVVDPAAIRETASSLDTLDYESPPSSGWGDDRLLRYRHGDDRGYVWHTAWDTPAEASEFATAYRTLLSAYGAEQRGPETWEIPDERPFEDAFHVRQTGTTVRIVNAPTVGSLPALAPDVRAATTATATRSAGTGGDPRTVSATTARSTVEQTRGSSSASPTDGQGTGFGVWPALVATGLILVVLRRR